MSELATEALAPVPNTSQAPAVSLLKNEKSGLAMTTSYGSTENGTRLIQWPIENTPEQHWRFESAGDGAYYIRLLKDGKGRYVAVSDGQIREGQPLIIWPYIADAPDHKWYRDDKSNGLFVIRSYQNSQLAIAVSDASTEPRAELILWTYHGTSDQNWIVETR